MAQPLKKHFNDKVTKCPQNICRKRHIELLTRRATHFEPRGKKYRQGGGGLKPPPPPPNHDRVNTFNTILHWKR